MHSEQWGLTCGKTPRFGAGLVQEGNRLHYRPTGQDLPEISVTMRHCALTERFR